MKIRSTPAKLRRPLLIVTLLASLVSSGYWLGIASPRYVSEAQVIIQKTDLAANAQTDLSSLFGLNSSSRADQMLLRAHLLSLDMVRKLDQHAQVRAHFSNEAHDPLSRLLDANAPIEDLREYLQSRIDVHYDDTDGVLKISAQAFAPDVAQTMTRFLVSEGEHFMNSMAHALSEDQLAFLKQKVGDLKDRAILARQAVLQYQNEHNLVSPQASTQTLVEIVAKLQVQKIEIETQRRAFQAYLNADHPNVVQLTQQIAALEKQIASEEARLTSKNGKGLNKVVEAYQILEMEAQFALELYNAALTAFERVQIESSRNIKKMSVLQAPSLPESSTEPRRLYNALLSILVIIGIAALIKLSVGVIKDHQD